MAISIDREAAVVAAPRRPRRELPRYLFFCGALVCGYAPLLGLQMLSLWQRSHYQFVPLLLVGTLVLLWRRGLGAALRNPLQARPNRPAATLLGSALCLQLLAVASFSPWLASVSAILACGGCLWYVAGFEMGVRGLAPWWLLWLTIPPPFGLDLEAIQRLQGLTARASSLALDVVGYRHFMAGNVLELPGQKLFVDEACSGIQSLVAIVAFTALFVVLTERPCVRAILLLCGSVFWAVAANLVRIVTIAVVKVEAGLDLSSGWRHELLGLGMFLLLLLMCLSTDRICEFLFAPVNLVGRGNLLSRAWNWSMGGTPQRLDSADASDSDATLVGDMPASVESAFEPARSRMFGSRAVAALYLALGVVQVLALRVPKPAAGDLTGSPTRLLAIAESLEGELLPEEQAGWRRTDFSVRQRDQRSEFGEFSRIWSYQSAGAAAAFALDYPFYGWHDLTACYRGQGWEVAQRRVVTVERGDGEPGWSYIEAELRRPDGDLSYLYFSLFDQFGRPLAPPVAGHWSDRLRSLTRVPTWKLLTRQESLALLPAAAQGQAQLFVEVGEPFSEVQRQQLAERFVTFRNAVQRRYALPRETAE